LAAVKQKRKKEFSKKCKKVLVVRNSFLYSLGMSNVLHSSTARTYSNSHYSVVISKFPHIKPMVSFFNGVTFTAVYVNRKEAAYALRKFKKNLAASAQIA